MSLDELLRLMPVCSVTTSAADVEWRHWQVEVETKLQEGDIAAFPSLTFVAGLLAGQGDILTRASGEAEQYDHWTVSCWLCWRRTSPR